MTATFENCEKVVSIIRQKTSQTAKIGIVCGSGLGGIGEIIENPIYFPYAELPGFHVSEVAGHKSRLVLGKINGVNVCCMQGRFHGYEGISYNACAFPIRVMKLLGIESIIVTNAAGGINRDYKLGDFMILRDHLPLAMYACNNPLVGPNDSKFGPRFIPTSNAYSKELAELAFATGKELNLSETIRHGCYAMMPGPNYESIAELNMLKTVGADAVGMSTAPEIMVAHHCGIKCLGISMITNICPLDYEDNEIANHEEVIEIANLRAQDMVKLVQHLIPKM